MIADKLTFTHGHGGYGLEDEYMADIVVHGLDKGIIACQAASREQAESLRQFVLDRLQARQHHLANNLTINTVEGLEAKVVHWAADRGIFASSTPAEQMMKTMEELGELAGGIAKNKPDVILDSIGDVLVTLILQAHMQGLTLATCLEAAYSEISQRKGRMVGGVFVKEADLPAPDVGIDGANLAIDAGDSEGGYPD